jgi:hypothetical protein
MLKLWSLAAGIAAAVVVTAPAAAPPKVFPAGIYYVKPSPAAPGGRVQLLGGKLPTIRTGIGFDIGTHTLVTTDNGSTINVYSPAGALRRVPVKGLYAIVRPTLSPDEKQVAVQATETPVAGGRPAFLTIYVVNLSNGTWRRLAPRPAVPEPGAEMPEWISRTSLIAHWAAEDGCLVVTVRAAATGADRVTIRERGTTGCYQPRRGILDGPRFHLASSSNGKRLLVPGQMQVYDVATGALVADLHEAALAGLTSAGYEPDSRFPGQAGGGTFPLDADFSPDGKQIVFDGGVQRNGAFGVLLMRINIDGTGFTVLGGPLQANPSFSNGHNFSHVTPVWFRASRG